MSASFTPGWGSFPPLLLEFWTERHLCTLTTLRRDGRPHVVPVGAVLDHEQECAWVITGRASVKARHLASAAPVAPPVALCQVDRARWSTLEGTAVVRTDEESVARAVALYAGRYRQPRPNPERVALRVTVERLLCSNGLV